MALSRGDGPPHSPGAFRAPALKGASGDASRNGAFAGHSSHHIPAVLHVPCGLCRSHSPLKADQRVRSTFEPRKRRFRSAPRSTSSPPALAPPLCPRPVPLALAPPLWPSLSAPPFLSSTSASPSEHCNQYAQRCHCRPRFWCHYRVLRSHGEGGWWPLGCVTWVPTASGSVPRQLRLPSPFVSICSWGSACRTPTRGRKPWPGGLADRRQVVGACVLCSCVFLLVAVVLRGRWAQGPGGWGPRYPSHAACLEHGSHAPGGNRPSRPSREPFVYVWSDFLVACSHSACTRAHSRVTAVAPSLSPPRPDCGNVWGGWTSPCSSRIPCFSHREHMCARACAHVYGVSCICMYVCACVYKHVDAWCVCAHKRVCVHVATCAVCHACACVCGRAQPCVCAWVHCAVLCVRVQHMCVRGMSCVHTRACVCMCMHVCSHMCVCTSMWVRVRVHKHVGVRGVHVFLDSTLKHWKRIRVES